MFFVCIEPKIQFQSWNIHDLTDLDVSMRVSRSGKRNRVHEVRQIHEVLPVRERLLPLSSMHFEEGDLHRIRLSAGRNAFHN